MCHTCNKKWQTTPDGRNELLKEDKIRKFGLKETHKYLGILEARDEKWKRHLTELNYQTKKRL